MVQIGGQARACTAFALVPRVQLIMGLHAVYTGISDSTRGPVVFT